MFHTQEIALMVNTTANKTIDPSACEAPPPVGVRLPGQRAFSLRLTSADPELQGMLDIPIRHLVRVGTVELFPIREPLRRGAQSVVTYDDPRLGRVRRHVKEAASHIIMEVQTCCMTRGLAPGHLYTMKTLDGRPVYEFHAQALAEKKRLNRPGLTEKKLTRREIELLCTLDKWWEDFLWKQGVIVNDHDGLTTPDLWQIQTMIDTVLTDTGKAMPVKDFCTAYVQENLRRLGPIQSQPAQQTVVNWEYDRGRLCRGLVSLCDSARRSITSQTIEIVRAGPYAFYLKHGDQRWNAFSESWKEVSEEHTGTRFSQEEAVEAAHQILRNNLLPLLPTTIVSATAEEGSSQTTLLALASTDLQTLVADAPTVTVTRESSHAVGDSSTSFVISCLGRYWTGAGWGPHRSRCGYTYLQAMQEARRIFEKRAFPRLETIREEATDKASTTLSTEAQRAYLRHQGLGG